MTFEILALFLGYAVPMVISPGPGNTILAASGGRFGVHGSVPFWAGFETGNLVLCLVYGFGLGEVFEQNPQVYAVLKWAGIAYVLYLAWSFFKAGPVSAGDDVQPLGFADGFASVCFNPKIHSTILVMFSQFLNPDAAVPAQVARITAVFLLVCLLCHWVWIYGGQVVFRRFTGAAALRVQAYVFGGCMVLVAAYMALV
ncbi:LysE family translocator [Arenibaculum sp.]|uniref:LysE family translocator n=1 Tax=Arenibaculum sp. TaxID=2865862 RepID=UPI002E1205BD|nr:LysE family translocator [Arenibaculum sp.]